jgi:aspartyl-tRNA(Asn)/glutamyl-tRNA(Gln) amidotransferase subunit A
MICSLKNCFAAENYPLTLGMKSTTLIVKPSYSSTVYNLLKQNHKVIFSELSQFCCGTLDPQLRQKDGLKVGASSTGSVLDLESDLCEVSVCTDTGGSTILPASRARLYGFKPTYGRISRYGLNPLCSCLDTVALMAKDLSKLKTIFEVLDRYDPKDALSVPTEKRVSKSLKLAIARNLFTESDLEVLRKLYPSAELLNLQLPPLKVLEGAYYYVLCPDFLSNMVKFDGVQNKFDPTQILFNYQKIDSVGLRSQVLSSEVKSRILMGAELLKDYNYGLIVSFFKDLKKLLGSKTWILPVAQDLLTDDVSQLGCEYVLLANFTRRPGLVVPNSLFKGYYILGPKNSDWEILNLVV